MVTPASIYCTKKKLTTESMLAGDQLHAILRSILDRFGRFIVIKHYESSDTWNV